MKWHWFFCGVFFLLISAFMDNARGPLLPVLATLYQFDYSMTGQILVVGQLAALGMTALLLPATNRWSLRTVGMASCLIGIVVSMSSLLVSTKYSILLWGATLGGAIAVMGSLSSLFTAQSANEENKTKAMAACHATYGLASFAGPIIAGVVLVEPSHWQRIYLGAIPLMFCLAWYCWRFAPTRSAPGSTHVKQPLDLQPQHRLAVCVVVFYVGGEVLAAMWMTSWFISSGHSLQVGAQATALFFVLMTVTRLLCSFFITSRRVVPVIWASLVVPTICFTLGRTFEIYWLVPFMGLVGPFFPLFVTHTSMRFPERSRTIIIWMLTAMQALLAIMNFLTGRVADQFGMGIAYWSPPMLMVICGVLFAASQKLSKTQV